MAKHIVELTDALSNKIAAGEVVERPASVVKELVENAIDAGSTVIDILVEEAGLNKITIIDNGSGIEEEDVATAFLRHATSKIKNEADLFRVHTLGFRGEALPSIASVSHLAMETSTGETKGTTISLEGGKIIEQKSGHARKGTQIEVSQLFFNTPARLKYLKSLPTELGNITDILNRLALAHPDISFRFSHNGKPLLQTNGNGDLRQVIAAIYGISIAKKSIPVKAESLDFKISGYAVLPEVNRSNRNYISTIINGRFIKNFALVKAIQEGYHTLLPIGRFPIIVLQIEMDPIIVDVNVHPAKLEVRLSKEKELGQLISQMIKEAFHKLQLIPEGEISKKQKEVQKSEQIQMSFEENKPAKEIPTLFSKPTIPEYVPSDEDAPRDDDFILETMPSYEPELQAEQEEHPKERIPKMYPIGQMHATYIFAQMKMVYISLINMRLRNELNTNFTVKKLGKLVANCKNYLYQLCLNFQRMSMFV